MNICYKNKAYRSLNTVQSAFYVDAKPYCSSSKKN